MQFVNPSGPQWTPGIVWAIISTTSRRWLAMAQKAKIKVILGNVPNDGLRRPVIQPLAGCNTDSRITSRW